MNAALEKDSGNPYLKWVEAQFKGNNTQQIEESILNSDTKIQVYDTKYVDTGFELVLEFLSIVNTH